MLIISANHLRNSCAFAAARQALRQSLPERRRELQNEAVFFDRDIAPWDLPAPPTADEVARQFARPIMTLVDQPSLDEAGIGVATQSSSGHSTISRLELTEATISYTLWRNPDERSDPANLADLDDRTRDSLDAEPAWPLPDWLITARERMRYPSLWEAVRTTYVVQPTALPWHTVRHALVEHVNYVLVNSFREERTDGSIPPTLEGEVTEKCVEAGIPLSVDGVWMSGLRIDTDPHILGLAIDLGDKLLTAAIPRDELEFLELAFVTRPATAS